MQENNRTSEKNITLRDGGGDKKGKRFENGRRRGGGTCPNVHGVNAHPRMVKIAIRRKQPYNKKTQLKKTRNIGRRFSKRSEENSGRMPIFKRGWGEGGFLAKWDPWASLAEEQLMCCPIIGKWRKKKKTNNCHHATSKRKEMTEDARIAHNVYRIATCNMGRNGQKQLAKRALATPAA